MITYEHFKFLNLQYIYCIIYSMFGGRCTTVDDVTGEPIATSTISVGTPIPNGSGAIDFWTWLFGGGHGAAHPVAQPQTGIFGALADFVTFIGGILAALWGIFSVLSYTLSGLLFLIVLGSFFGLLYIRYQELSLYGTLPKDTAQTWQMRSRWQLILDKGMSASPKDWKDGIIEADVILGEVLEKFGYQGETTADKLRSVPEGAFVTLPNAWEAHRIKNFVSARSSDFILTQREAFRVLKLYEQVFEEFNFV